jgi:hypothetical protein
MISDSMSGMVQYQAPFNANSYTNHRLHQSDIPNNAMLYENAGYSTFYDTNQIYDPNMYAQSRAKNLSKTVFDNESSFHHHHHQNVADSAYASSPVSLSSSPFSSLSSSSTGNHHWDRQQKKPVAYASNSSNEQNNRIKRRSRVEMQAKKKKSKQQQSQQNDENKTTFGGNTHKKQAAQAEKAACSNETDHGFNLPPQAEPKKRVSANKKERRRTQSINNAFADLRDRIPQIPTDTKLSKIKTLKLATDYIEYLMKVLNDNEASNQLEPFKPDLGKLRRESRIKEIKVSFGLKVHFFDFNNTNFNSKWQNCIFGKW